MDRRRAGRTALWRVATEVFTIARENGIRSLAFPAISCGVYRFPVERAVKIAVGETITEL